MIKIKWSLNFVFSPSLTDLVLSSRCHYQLGLATLLNNTGDIVQEPESGHQYRLRAIGGDNINDVILIILDDIERSFESEEESLASLTLKICLSSSPTREGLAALRHWTYNNKIYSAEVHTCQLDRESLSSSDNVTLQSISPELFR